MSTKGQSQAKDIDRSDDDDEANNKQGNILEEVRNNNTWFVLEGFQMATWLCFFYCCNAIPISVLSVLNLLFRFISDATGDVISLNRECIEEDSSSPSSELRCDALELLIRLALRSSHGFLERQILSRYGEVLKVIPSIAMLTSVNVPGDVDERAHASGGLISVLTGEDIASLLYRYAISESKEIEERVMTALSTPSVQELRRATSDFWRAFHSRRDAKEAGTISKEKMSLLVGKKELISFLLSCSCDYTGSFDKSELIDGKRREEIFIQEFSAIWNIHIGRVIIIHKEVRNAIECVSGLFHILTSNFSSVNVFSWRSYEMSPSIVAVVPTTLLHYFQREILVECKKNSEVERAAEKGKENHRISSPSWSGIAPQSIQHVQIFSDEEQLYSYFAALELHRRIFRITDGAPNFAKKLLGRDAVFVQNLFDEVMKLVNEGNTINLREYKRMKKITEPSDHSRKGIPLYTSLYQNGFDSAHLLQFTPQYRLYASLELIAPLLESLQLYDKAIRCIRVILYRPLFALYPRCTQDTAIRCDDQLEKALIESPATLKLYYRWEKRGFWFHRLALCYSHLHDQKQALSVLKDAHERWRKVEGLTLEEKEVLNSMLDHRFDGDPTGYVKSRELKSLASSVLSTVSRRGRMLRGLWHHRSSAVSDHDTNNKVMYHAAMEFLLTNYISRSNQIAIEKSMCSIFKRLYRWTPLPRHMYSMTERILAPPILIVKGIRDSNNSKGWKDPERQNACASCVEEMVLQHFLEKYNLKALSNSTPPPEGAQQRKRNSSATEIVLGGTEWRGLHCEGRWITCLWRILLEECYFCGYSPRASNMLGDEVDCRNERNVWLSKLQNGPLDASSAPLLFSFYRKKQIEYQLQRLEKLSDAEFLNFISKRCYGSNVEHELSQLGKEFPKKMKKEEKIENEKPRTSTPPNISICPHPPLYLNGFPLLEIVPSIPRKPLLQLLRCMFVDSLFSGFSFSTSGFPDLILWRHPNDCELKNQSNFKLFEVKSPHDELSARQIAVNDCLLQCGFEVAIVRVEQCAEVKC